MKIRWKKVFYYFLAFDFLFAIKSCNLSPENETKESEKSTKKNQVSITLSGLVTKNDSITPIPFCDITLLNADSIIIAKTTTDFNGCYSFPNITPQNYIISFSTIGFQTNLIEFNIQRDTNIKTSLQLKKEKNTELVSVVTCYDIASIDDSTFEDNKHATEDFFSGISNKNDLIIDEKESDEADTLNEQNKK